MRRAGSRAVALTVTLLTCLLVACSSTGSPTTPDRAGPIVEPTDPLETTAPAPRDAAPPPTPEPRTLRGTQAWRLDHPALDRQIEGYAHLRSTKRGGRIRIMVSTTARRFRAHVYRIGGYRGRVRPLDLVLPPRPWARATRTHPAS